MRNSVQQSSPTTRDQLPAAVTPTTALDGVFAELEREHLEATTLMKQLRASTSADQRREVWTALRAELIAHERSEAQEVYKVFEAYPALGSIVYEHTHQAHGLETLIGELDALSTDEQSWDDGLQRLDVALKRHVEDEETDFFPSARNAIGKDLAEELRVPYLSAKRSLIHAL
jgi:hypothetical protein